MGHWVARGKSISTAGRGNVGEGAAITVADLGPGGSEDRLDELVERGVLVQASSAEEAARIVPAGGPKRLVGAARATGGPEQLAAHGALQTAQAAAKDVTTAQVALTRATADGDTAAIEEAQRAVDDAERAAADANSESIRLAEAANQAN